MQENVQLQRRVALPRPAVDRRLHPGACGGADESAERDRPERHDRRGLRGRGRCGRRRRRTLGRLHGRSRRHRRPRVAERLARDASDRRPGEGDGARPDEPDRGRDHPARRRGERRARPRPRPEGAGRRAAATRSSPPGRSATRTLRSMFPRGIPIGTRDEPEQQRRERVQEHPGRAARRLHVAAVRDRPRPEHR